MHHSSCSTSIISHTRHEGGGGGSRRSRLPSPFTPRIWRPQASNERGPKMNTASAFVDSAFTRTAIFFRKEIQVKHSQVLTEYWRQFPPQSSGWNPLQLNNFLHLANVPHRHPCSITALLGWHQSQPLSRSPSRIDGVTAAALLGM